MSDLMLQAVLRMPPELWRDDAWDVKQRHGRYVQAADELEALRAALDQERADNERLRAFACDCEQVLGSDDEIQMLLNEHGLTDMDGVPTALLSGRGEGNGNG